VIRTFFLNMRLQIIATFASTYMMSFEATAKPQSLFFPTDDGKDSGINFAIPPDLNKNETIGFDAGALQTTTESHSNVLFQQEEKGDVDFVDNFQAFALRTFISQYGITEPLFEKCSSDGKSVPYFDSARAKIDCFEILSQGPCQGNQWLFFERLWRSCVPRKDVCRWSRTPGKMCGSWRQRTMSAKRRNSTGPSWSRPVRMFGWLLAI